MKTPTLALTALTVLVLTACGGGSDNNNASAYGADGKFSGTSGTCAVTGSLTPRPSGKNVFTFSVVSGPAPCARPNEVMNGVAVEFSIGSVRQLMAAGSVETRANGIGWVGSR